MAKITHYTKVEGGYWKPMYSQDEIPSDAELEQLRQQAQQDGHGDILLGSYALHSFKTDDGREWDVHNGWRVKRA